MPADPETPPDPRPVRAIHDADDAEAARMEAALVEQTDKAGTPEEEAASALLDQSPSMPPL